jgi:hypothetical protein
VLVFGCGYRRIADATCSATTLRRRWDEWISTGVAEQLRLAVLGAIAVVGPLPERPVVHLDAGYDYQPCRQVLAERGLVGQIATRGAPAPLSRLLLVSRLQAPDHNRSAANGRPGPGPARRLAVAGGRPAHRHPAPPHR